MVAALHGPPGQQFELQTQALYLDGPELRTTRTLLNWGWRPGDLHVPNFSPTDFLAIQETAAREFDGHLNVYHQTSSKFLEDAAAPPWAAAIRQKHGGHGPYSLVYMDYTNVNQWARDVELLCKERLFVPGAVFAVTCPARAPHVSASEVRTLTSRLISLAGVKWLCLRNY